LCVQQRIIASGLGLLGLASIGLGVASATAWRADDTLVVTAPAPTAGALVITAPGVLELGGGPVTVTARASSRTKVVLAIGKESDVAGWVGTDAHTVLTGLADRRTLAARPSRAHPGPAAAGAPAPAPSAAGPATTADPGADPDGSDLWVAQAAAPATATLRWTPTAGRWTLLAAGTGDRATAPQVVLSWPQQVTTPWLVPGVVVGTVLLLAGAALGALPWLRARRPGPTSWHPVETGATPIVVGGGTAGAVAAGGRGQPGQPDDAAPEVLTRRQLRAATATVPTPGVLPRLALHWRGQGKPGAGSGLTAGELPVRPPASPAAATPVRPAGAPVLSAADPAADGPEHLGWTPRPPLPSTAGPRALPPVRAPAPVSAPPSAPTAARTSRADGWRRAWGFPGADAPDGTQPSPPDPAQAADGAEPPHPDADRPGGDA
jgi:hypothetical protein